MSDRSGPSKLSPLGGEASESWSLIAAPEDDLPAALAGHVRPERILHAVNDLERCVAAVGEWVKDVQIHLVLLAQDDGAGGRLPAFQLASIWNAKTFEDLLHDSPTLEAVNRKLAAIEREAMRLATLTRASGRIPIADLRRFLESALDVERSMRQLLSDTWNRLANIDPLTGLGNRAAMLRKLAIESDRHARNQQPCCVAIIDLDYFKEVNDTYGHAVGDVVLRSVASLLAASIRPYDEVFRYGGDEFVLCLPNADLRTAWAIVDRLRLRVSQWTVPARNGEMLRATMSIGVAPLSASVGVEGSLELADRALYAAKQSGRNTLAVCSD